MKGEFKDLEKPIKLKREKKHSLQTKNNSRVLGGGGANR